MDGLSSPDDYIRDLIDGSESRDVNGAPINAKMRWRPPERSRSIDPVVAPLTPFSRERGRG